MATEEVNAAGPEGDQREKLLPPSEEDTPPVLKCTSASLNFSGLTPCQFGISAQSFTPAAATAAASSNRKDKSRLAQMKARRRSGIGVRGSPETNSLIRFMAQERMKTPPSTHRTPECVRSSPFLPRVASTLRQKMASFQSLMGVEESEACDPVPRQDSNTGGRIETRDYLSDENSKENHQPMMMPSPGKRRCLGPLEGCEVEIKEASAPILVFKLEEKEDGVFELQRHSRPLADDPGSPFCLPSPPCLQEMKPTGEDDSAGMSAVKKKKRVHFGGPLSPEFFDKYLPPSTPLQKGAMPARAPTPGGVQFRSLLKTPQRSESRPPQAQPDLSSPTTFGASPTLTMPRHFRMQSEGEGCDEDRKIVFPSMEEIDSAVTSDTAYTMDPQPLNLDAAFHEECLPQTVTESETKPSSSSEICVLDDPTSLLEEKRPEAGVEAPASVRSNNRRKKPEPERESTSEAPARSRSRKRKLPQQPEESEPVKRSTRSAAKLASGKMKANSTATRQWNRDVDRSLYGSRAYASKNPVLSPITERLSFIGQPPTQHTPSAGCAEHEAPTPESHVNDESQTTGELAVTHAGENPTQRSITSPQSSKVSVRGRGGRPSGQQPGARGMKKRKVSVADGDLLSETPLDPTRGETEEHCEEQTLTSLEASRETLLYHAAPTQRGVDRELDAKTSAIFSSEETECDTGLNPCPASGEELTDLNLPAELLQREAEQGERSAEISSAAQQQGEQQLNEHQRSHEEEEKVQPENNSRSSQEDEGPSDSHLAPWQADFNFEDVFKPVATRGQQSVRRSLRNQSSSHISAGLAWLPWTSPESGKEGRRKTRGRRLSSAPPVPPSVSEETRDDTS